MNPRRVQRRPVLHADVVVGLGKTTAVLGARARYEATWRCLPMTDSGCNLFLLRSPALRAWCVCGSNWKQHANVRCRCCDAWVSFGASLPARTPDAGTCLHRLGQLGGAVIRAGDPGMVGGIGLVDKPADLALVRPQRRCPAPAPATARFGSAEVPAARDGSLRIAFYCNLMGWPKRSGGGVRQWVLTMANALVERGPRG